MSSVADSVVVEPEHDDKTEKRINDIQQTLLGCNLMMNTAYIGYVFLFLSHT